MIEPIRCKKDTCEIEVQTGLFGCKYAHCWHCGKSAGIKNTEEEALAEWNRCRILSLSKGVEIGGFIQVVAPPRGVTR